MAQSPAVVIIARHGMRLDAADQRWHLSTPTPYDPPLTFGGWNQCRALGTRIASLLHTRKQSSNSSAEVGGNQRRKKKQKVVIHTSPFLRCLQTSVAIAAGMAQFEPPKERPSAPRSPATKHSYSPRLRAKDATTSPHLAPIVEPKNDLAHDLARKRALGEAKHYRKTKIRVDAFLGEWLNPQYFDQITPPPPSPMMVAGAKAELMVNDNIDAYAPTLSNKSSGSSLWGGAHGRQSSSRESVMDDWSHVTEALPAPMPRRDRANSTSSVGSNESSSGRKSPYRPGGHLQPLTSIVPRETSIYQPPTPSYAISSSDNIPRGYVTHARDATADVDYQWDSSRPPQDWGNGGSYGEEWSAMHKRFRRGLNNLMQWYSQHDADDRGEDALGIDQAERRHSYEEEEELVVILVTHGAGSNALIGALTNQPVLLDVGMASLTMAVKKDNAPPPLLSTRSNADGLIEAETLAHSLGAIDLAHLQRRRSSLDIGLSAIYDMKLVSSSEHLRSGTDSTKALARQDNPANKTVPDAPPRYKSFGAGPRVEARVGNELNWNLSESSSRQGKTSTAIGSIRRPSAPDPMARGPSPGHIKLNSLTLEDRPLTPPNLSTGLWTPPSGRSTPRPSATTQKEEKETSFPALSEGTEKYENTILKIVTSTPDSRTASIAEKPDDSLNGVRSEQERRLKQDSVMENPESEHENDGVGELPQVGERVPTSLSRSLSQKGLWGTRPGGDMISRSFADSPKRRWTLRDKD